MKAWTRNLFAACALTALLAACNQSEAPTTAPAPKSEAPATGAAKSETPAGQTAANPAPASGKKFRLAFVSNNAADFWAIARAGCQQAVKDLGDVELNFQMNPSADAAGQQRIVDDLISAGIDGMAISPRDPANQTPMLNKVAGQALLITQDSDAPESNRACYIGTDNVAAGRQAGEEIKKALPGGGKIELFVGTMDAQNALDRVNGIKETLAGSKISIIDVRADDADPVRAKSNAADALVKNPDVNCLVGIYSYNGPAILNAVKDAGKVGQIKIVCFDENSETLQGVKDGQIVATIVQQPYEFGYQAMKTMEAYLKGDKSVIPADKKIIVPTQVIDQSKVDAFWSQLKERLGQK